MSAEALLGHSASDVTDGYGDGFSVEALNDELQKTSSRGLGLTLLADVARYYVDGWPKSGALRRRRLMHGP